MCSAANGCVTSYCNAELLYSFSTQARFIAQLIVSGGQVVGRAFARALREEMQCKRVCDVIIHHGCVGPIYVGILHRRVGRDLWYV